MEDIIAAVILLIVVSLAVLYVYKAKKGGAKCVGCPHCKSCATKSGGSSCGCGSGRP